MGRRPWFRRRPRLVDSWCPATALFAQCHWPPAMIIGVSPAYDSASQSDIRHWTSHGRWPLYLALAGLGPAAVGVMTSGQ